MTEEKIASAIYFYNKIPIHPVYISADFGKDNLIKTKEIGHIHSQKELNEILKQDQSNDSK